MMMPAALRRFLAVSVSLALLCPEGFVVRSWAAEAASQDEASPGGGRSPLPQGAAATMDGLSVGDDTVTVKFSAAVRCRGFLVEDPPRLVLEFRDTENRLEAKTVAGRGPLIKLVRTAQYQTTPRMIARVVIDLYKSADYRLTRSGNSLLVQLAAAPGAAQVDNAPPEAAAAAAAVSTAAAAADAAVSIAAAADPPSSEPLSPLEKRVTLNLHDMPLAQVLRMIARQSRANFVVQKELQGRRCSIFVQQVLVREALRAILETQGLFYERIGTSDTFIIQELGKVRQRLATRIFVLKHTQLMEPGAAGKAAQQSAFTIVANVDSSQKGQGGQGQTGQTGASSDMAQVVRGLLSPQGRLQIYPQTNSLIVSDLLERFPQIEDVIETLDVPTPQISIQADLIETDAATARTLGLQYGGASGTLGSVTGGARTFQFPFGTVKTAFDGVNTPPSGGNSSVGMGVTVGVLSLQQFTAVLQAIETSNNSKYLSRPKVMTLNNKPAEIAITANTAVGIQSSSLIAQSGLLTTTAERETTGITLRVTPQVNRGGMITLFIEPSVTRPEPSAFFPTQFVDAQMESIRTSVRIQDGATLLIGGLLSDQKVKTVQHVPILWRIPLLGWLFTSTTTSTQKMELMIFITPRVIPG